MPIWNTILNSTFDMFKAFQIDLFHAEVTGSGNFVRHFKLLMQGVDKYPNVYERLKKRVTETVKLSFAWKENWHGQEYDKISKYVLLIMKDNVLDESEYRPLLSHVLYLRLLRCNIMDRETVRLVEYFYNLYTIQYRTKYGNDSLEFPNHHSVHHLIKEVDEHMIPPHLLWTQKFEKHHRVSRELLGKKQGVAWSVVEYGRSLTLRSMLSQEKEINWFLSVVDNTNPVRYFLETFNLMEEEPPYVVTSKIYFAPSRVSPYYSDTLLKLTYITVDKRGRIHNEREESVANHFNHDRPP